MHRYWKDSFPEDFKDYKEKNVRDSFNKSSLELALQIADSQIGILLDFQNKEEKVLGSFSFRPGSC